MTDNHFLIVPEDPDEGMEIEHPESCPRHDQAETVTYSCIYESMQREYGIDAFFSTDEKPHPFFGVRETVTPGRHPVEYWHRKIPLPPHIGGVEYDHGLTIPAGSGGAA